MAGRWAFQRASLRSAAPRVATCIVLVAGATLVAASPAAASAPSAPSITGLVAGPGVGVMSLRWSAPKFSGGALITGYEYRVQIDNGSFSLQAPLATATATRAVAPCLAPAAAGHGCAYEVRATNGTPGAWSIPVAATWLPPSIAILGRSVGGPDVNTATLQWRAPKTSGGLEVSYQYMIDAGSGFSGPFTIDPATITAVTTYAFPVLSAMLPCAPTGPVLACSFILAAVNAAGTSMQSKTRVAAFRHPGPPTDLQVETSAVALGTGAATQAVSWNAPLNVGGLPLTDNAVYACSTAGGSACFNTSSGWVPFADLTGSPPATATVYGCPANGRCAYEVFAKNARGKGWAFTFAGSGGPTNLSGTSVAGHIDLQWLNPVTPGTSFGNFVLFACNTAQNCTNGSWTNVPGDAAPWTRVDLSGTATATSYVCGVGTQCMFRVGYVDGAGNIGGVSNAVTLTGQ
jgi:hypothetical protein